MPLSDPEVMHPDDELDFTKPGAIPAPAPPPEKAAKVRKEAEAGDVQLRQAGFYVAIARHSAVRIPPRNGKKYVLLVVEDDADLAQLLIDIFMLGGFEVRWAANRAEINAEFNRRAKEIDLVLLDIVLPDANGLQVLQRIRGHPKIANLPVILMTGKSASEDVLAGLAAGADGYVSKPFKVSALMKSVNSVLGNA
jgi:two-component system OmpR family response regulator